jgi:hypothetical protein
MKTIEMYVNGEKWKNTTISDIELGRGHFPIDSSVYSHYEDRGRYDFGGLIVTPEEVHRVEFEIESYSYMYANQSVSPIIYDDLLKRSMDKRLDFIFMGRRIHDISFDRNSFITTWYRAECNDPNFYISEEGNIEYKKIEKKKVIVKITIKKRRNYFEWIDLD